jgi:hypothetical protein
MTPPGAGTFGVSIPALPPVTEIALAFGGRTR